MTTESQDQVSIPIREETLGIKKNWVQTGQVECHKDIIMEQKNISVPVMREELIIEKKFIDAACPNQSVHTETIRIPLREERVEIKKQTFDLEKVDIYKQRLQQMELVDEVLKKEVLFLKTTGNVDLEISDGFSCNVLPSEEVIP